MMILKQIANRGAGYWGNADTGRKRAGRAGQGDKAKAAKKEAKLAAAEEDAKKQAKKEAEQESLKAKRIIEKHLVGLKKARAQKAQVGPDTAGAGTVTAGWHSWDAAAGWDTSESAFDTSSTAHAGWDTSRLEPHLRATSSTASSSAWDMSAAWDTVGKAGWDASESEAAMPWDTVKAESESAGWDAVPATRPKRQAQQPPGAPPSDSSLLALRAKHRQALLSKSRQPLSPPPPWLKNDYAKSET